METNFSLDQIQLDEWQDLCERDLVEEIEIEFGTVPEYELIIDVEY